jgi:hypothetical protein
MFSTHPVTFPNPSTGVGQALAFARETAEGIPSAHPALVRGEVELLLNVLRSDVACRELLAGLSVREQDHVIPYIAALTASPPCAGAPPLGEHVTLARRAALGLLLIETILQDPRASSLDVSARMADIGRRYQPRGHGDASDAQALSNFVRVFIVPILSYLGYERSTDDLVRTMLVRYKQRCEWFERDRLVEIAKTKDAGNRINLMEKRLKSDLYRYLFDNGVDFTLEPFTPHRSAKPDLVSVKLLNGHKLVLEVKVYDGVRSSCGIVYGIKQAR